MVKCYTISNLKRRAVKMRKALLAIMALAFVASLSYAAEGASPVANEPVGAVVEATGIFVGNVVSVVTTGETGNASVTVADETGKTMVFPVDPAVKIVDAAVNVVTLNQLKTGDKVAVEYTKDEKGAEKAKSISVMK